MKESGFGPKLEGEKKETPENMAKEKLVSEIRELRTKVYAAAKNKMEPRVAAEWFSEKIVKFRDKVTSSFPSYAEYAEWHGLGSSFPHEHPEEIPFLNLPEEYSVKKFLEGLLEELEVTNRDFQKR